MRDYPARRLKLNSFCLVGLGISKKWAWPSCPVALSGCNCSSFPSAALLYSLVGCAFFLCKCFLNVHFFDYISFENVIICAASFFAR